jgi:hypothetical protein
MVRIPSNPLAVRERSLQDLRDEFLVRCHANPSPAPPVNVPVPAEGGTGLGWRISEGTTDTSPRDGPPVYPQDYTVRSDWRPSDSVARCGERPRIVADQRDARPSRAPSALCSARFCPRTSHGSLPDREP